MTKKFSFLLWLGNNITQFGIANSLQEKIDCKFDGIISSNEKFRDFYQKQNFVKFENLWVYPDYLKNSGGIPDMDYLSKFEKKYQISLWEIIFSERLFSSDYNKFHKFTKNELLLILEQACRFFETIFEKINPDVVITKLPIGHDDYLFYKMCDALNLRILYIRNSRIGFRATLVDNKESGSNKKIDSNNNLKSFEEIQNYLEKFSSFKQIQKNEQYSTISLSSKISSFLKFYFSSSYNNKNYSSLGKNRWNLTKNESKFMRKSRLNSREKYLNEICMKKVDSNIPFVFFPLHVEPERHLMIDNRFYSNQIFIIECISKSLPINFELYVKEHPRMRHRGWREPSFYDNILDLPNVKLLHPSIEPKIIFKNCSLVISISGTLGFEAVYYNKPSILFSLENFDFPKSLIQINNPKDLPGSIKKALQTKPDPIEIGEFIQNIISNSFEFNIFEIDEEFNHKFPYLGYLDSSVISPIKIQEFLEEKKEIFEKLTNVHLEKIQDLIKPT